MLTRRRDKKITFRLEDLKSTKFNLLSVMELRAKKDKKRRLSGNLESKDGSPKGQGLYLKKGKSMHHEPGSGGMEEHDLLSPRSNEPVAPMDVDFGAEESFINRLNDLSLFIQSELQRAYEEKEKNEIDSPLSPYKRKTMLPGSVIKHNRRKNEALKKIDKDKVMMFNKSWDLVLCLMIGTHKAIKSLYDKINYELTDIDFSNKFTFEFAMMYSPLHSNLPKGCR